MSDKDEMGSIAIRISVKGKMSDRKHDKHKRSAEVSIDGELGIC